MLLRSGCPTGFLAYVASAVMTTAFRTATDVSQAIAKRGADAPPTTDCAYYARCLFTKASLMRAPLFCFETRPLGIGSLLRVMRSQRSQAETTCTKELSTVRADEVLCSPSGGKIRKNQTQIPLCCSSFQPVPRPDKPPKERMDSSAAMPGRVPCNKPDRSIQDFCGTPALN